MDHTTDGPHETDPAPRTTGHDMLLGLASLLLASGDADAGTRMRIKRAANHDNHGDYQSNPKAEMSSDFSSGMAGVQ